jgi:hypothetical protein
MHDSYFYYCYLPLAVTLYSKTITLSFTGEISYEVDPTTCPVRTAEQQGIIIAS